MGEKKEPIQQPNEVLQQKLDEILNATPEEFVMNGKKHTLGWIHNGTERKFTHVIQTEKNPHKTNCKIAAILLLNGWFKIFCFYWILWRWYYYFVDLDTVEVLRLMEVAKKKMQHEAFFLVTMYSTEMADVMMTMTKKEASHIQAAQGGAQPTP